MKSICLFCSYYTGENIPNYVKFYLAELKKHFSEVVLLTNEKTMSGEDTRFLNSIRVSITTYKNEGYDFGMWYKALHRLDTTQYDRIGLVNDSCILFNKLDFYFNWLDKQDVDYSGLTDCDLIKYHVQSYFIIINKKAVAPVIKYFEMNGIITDMKQLINTYEVGLSTYLINAGLKATAYYSFKNDVPQIDPCWVQAKSLIKAGYPFVKKKIIIRYYGDANLKSLIAHGFDPYPNHYIKLMKKRAPGININELLADMDIKKTFKQELRFHTIAFLSIVYGVYKKIRHLAKRIVWGGLKKKYFAIVTKHPVEKN